MRRITTKKEMYELLNTGVLGNYFKSWDSVAEALADGHTGNFGGARASARFGGFAGDGLSIEAAMLFEEKYRYQRPLKFYPRVPNHEVMINAEIARNPHGTYMRWDQAPGTHRDAMQRAAWTYGLAAKMIVERLCGVDSAEWKWLNWLMDNYDGPVSVPDFSCTVEFSIFSGPVGEHKERMVIWEVRAY